MKKKPAKRPVGRPIEYPESVFLGILKRYAKGENLLGILKEPGMPDWSTFWKRVIGPNAPEGLVIAHARARDSWAEHKVEEAMDITDKTEMGQKVSDGPRGKTVTKGDMVEHRRLKVSTRLWFAERVLAKSYSGRQQLTHANPDGSPLNLQPVINLTVLPAPK
jgi:hypothetical protein